MYGSILLPVDDSEGAAEIVDHAGAIARETGATVQVLFVADTTRDSVTVVDGEVLDGLVREGERVVANVASRLETLDVNYDTDVVQGRPAPTIVEYARDFDYDLIVLQTHGRTGLSHHLLGSVTEKVVRLSEVPVLTARMRPDERLIFPYENVLIPTDGSDGARAAAEHGLDLAETLDASVHVLSVVDDTWVGPEARATLSEDALERPANEAIEDVVEAAEGYDIPAVQTYLEYGSPASVIADAIESNDIHAVVMGTSGRSGIERVLLGSVAEKTVRTAPVPVVTVAP
ncbi:Nucleotide-binding protein, UspA family [Halanaeroarchaeum sp. HSR-CO]|uniref:universal stress protein n=1 Tax=Halanaeroarchaeum sp. HSR-CO TaxID=2866382 RepID=UPI00217E3F17|nr:universal stress protein [Halanaeroarchaeum sp. HSR-CO]UWG48160.1 Nucleotide-binding protein, UspA family [Halanaeroarchaeum sp. HSR-CO]